MLKTTKVAGSLLAGLALAVVAAIGVGVTGSHAVANQDGMQDKVLAIGDRAPNFTLTDVNGKEHTLKTYTDAGKIVVLEWFNPGCPFVVKHYADNNKTMTNLANKYKEQDVVWLAINSTNKNHGDFAKNAPMIKEWGVAHPVLMDTEGAVGKAFDAKTTPHMFIIDKNGVLAYKGAIDSHRQARAPRAGEQVTNYVDQALTQLVAGETVTTAETRQYGCSVKYAK